MSHSVRFILLLSLVHVSSYAQILIRYMINPTDEQDTKIVPSETNTWKAQWHLQQMGHDVDVVLVSEGMEFLYAFDDDTSSGSCCKIKKIFVWSNGIK